MMFHHNFIITQTKTFYFPKIILFNILSLKRLNSYPKLSRNTLFILTRTKFSAKEDIGWVLGQSLKNI